MSKIKPIYFERKFIGLQEAANYVKKMQPLALEKGESDDGEEFSAKYGVNLKRDGPIDACVSMGTTSVDLDFNEGDFSKKMGVERPVSNSILFNVYPRVLNCSEDRSGSVSSFITLEPGQSMNQIYGGFFNKDNRTDFLITINGADGKLIGALVFIQKS